MKPPSISALAFLLLSTGAGAFGPGGGIRSSRRHATRLNYSDIEPELAAATIDPKTALIESALYAGSEFPVRESPAPPSQAAKRSAASRVLRSREVSEIMLPSNKRKSQIAATSLHEIAWNQRYNELVEYKTLNGDCLVPQIYKPNKKLGYWVMQQRRQYRLQSDGKRSSLDGRVGAKRKQLLDEIGFVWRATRTARRLCLPLNNEDNEREEFKCDISSSSDFEGYMVERSNLLSDDEKRQIWLKRFELFR